jgi:hypothetical protein
MHVACQNDRARYRNRDPLNQARAKPQPILRYAQGEALSHSSPARAKPRHNNKGKNTYVQNQENWRDVASVVYNNIVQFLV